MPRSNATPRPALPDVNLVAGWRAWALSWVLAIAAAIAYGVWTDGAPQATGALTAWLLEYGWVLLFLTFGALHLAGMLLVVIDAHATVGARLAWSVAACVMLFVPVLFWLFVAEPRHRRRMRLASR